MARPRVICKDGFSVSVQAGKYLYCKLSENLKNGKYSHVECGFPSMADDLITEFAEDKERPTQTIYPYVPINVVDELINKHGGFFDLRIP